MIDAFLAAAAPQALAPWVNAAVALVAFGLLAAFGHWYGRGWVGPLLSSPAVADPRAAVLAGAIVVSGSALLSAREVGPNWMALAQIALMAAAAVCDGCRWQLPLPLTLGGIGLALVGVAQAGMPLMVFLAAVTVLSGLAVNALATRGTWQGGDVMATLWIGLALPATGLLAFAIGLAGVAAVRVMARWPDRSRAPIGGAWLLAAAALFALPGPFALAAVGTPVERPPQVSVRTRPLQSDEDKVVARLAGDLTARLALIDDHALRTAAAAETAGRIRGLMGDAPDSLSVDLALLAAALDAYDLDAVRAVSARLAVWRESPGPQEP